MAFINRQKGQAFDTKQDIEVPHADYKIQVKLKLKSSWR